MTKGKHGHFQHLEILLRKKLFIKPQIVTSFIIFVPVFFFFLDIFPRDVDFESSPLVGRLQDNQDIQHYDNKFFNFPNFAVAPSTYVEKHQQQQLKHDNPEPQYQQQTPSPTSTASNKQTQSSKQQQNKKV